MATVRSRRSSSGFTLIELILVVVILGIAAAVTVPNMVQSIRGNRLRTAARTVVMAGRYARSMAVLRQKEMALSFDLDAARLTVAILEPAPEQDASPEDGGEMGSAALIEQAEIEPTFTGGMTNLPAGRAEVDLERPLDRVKIEAVESDNGERYTEGSYAVIYRNNGRCTPYTVRLEDLEGDVAVIDVDALASATTSLEMRR